MPILSSFNLQQKDNMNAWKSRGKNESLCDTKGCVPLEVQIKKYLLAGRKLEELRAQNTFEDYQEAYHDIPIVTEDMDIVEILEYEELAKKRLAAMAKKNADDGAELSTTQPSAGAQTGDEAGAPTSEADAVVNSAQ